MSSTATPCGVLAVEPERVGREQQRRVVEGALVALGVDVAVDLEAARGALVADQVDVAVQALGCRRRWARGPGCPAPCASPAGSSPAAWPRTAARRVVLGRTPARRLAAGLAEGEEVVERTASCAGRAERQDQQQGGDEGDRKRERDAGRIVRLAAPRHRMSRRGYWLHGRLGQHLPNLVLVEFGGFGLRDEVAQQGTNRSRVVVVRRSGRRPARARSGCGASSRAPPGRA